MPLLLVLLAGVAALLAAHTHLPWASPGQARHSWQAALHLLTSIGTDHTEDPDVTTRRSERLLQHRAPPANGTD